MDQIQTVTVDDNVVILVMNRLRADGWQKLLCVDLNGKTYTLTTRNGEPQPDDAYDYAFLDAYREEHFRIVAATASAPAAKVPAHFSHA